ncbi:MAG: hypothetical protein A2511_03840 [Deltaproteobacteria bacterium RIFOXYD12_FULL_50_9]|nr:MAG: hypothetical protein A2511_03840 [Deltaproteobacteria bacterium RIFOXYD12_FULL_50_9]
MSKHIMKAQIVEKEAVIVIGWDGCMQHYHLSIKIDGKEIWSDLTLNYPGGYFDVSPYLFVIAGFGIELPDTIIDALTCDQQKNADYHEVKDWGLIDG